MEKKDEQVGMLPILEQPDYFPDLHASLNVYIRDWLAPRVPAVYRISVERGLSMSDAALKHQYYRPDVRIDNPASSGSIQSDTAVADAPSFVVDIPVQPQRYLAIRDQDKNLVTTIEILSPTNKKGDGYEDFRRKQEDLSAQEVHLVEIDLLREGKRRWRDERVDERDYIMTVQRGTSEIANVWATSLGQALPTIPIPLRSPDADVALPLEQIVKEYLIKSGIGRDLL
ncbi:MAG: DUF4058 family protein [Bacteroidota bacterium]